MGKKNLYRIVRAGWIAAFGLSLNLLNAQDFAYVTNVSGNNVSIVNTASNTVTQLVSVPGSPTGVAVSPGGDYVYVASQGTQTVSFINAASRSVVGGVKVPASPTRLEVLPGGSQLYVVLPLANQVAVIDVASRTLIATIPVGTKPNALAFHPSGTRVYVPNLLSGDVSVIDTESRRVLTTFKAGSGPSSVAVSRDGSAVFVSNQYSGTVTVHDVSGSLLTTISGFTFPNDLAITPDSSRLLVTNGNGGTVSIVDTGSRSVWKTLPTGSLSTAVAVSPDGSRGYVTNQNSFTLTVIDVAGGSVVKNIAKVGVYPVGVALRPAAGGYSGPIPPPVTPPTTPPTTPNCSYTLSTRSLSFEESASSSTVQITAPAGCAWDASSNASWIRFSSAASGSGSGSVIIDLEPNSGGDARTATLNIAGQNVSIVQAGHACSFSLSAVSATLPSSGGNGSFTLTTGTGCAWNVAGSHSWLTINSTSGAGQASLTFTAEPNPDNAPRTGWFTLANMQFTVTQSASGFSPIRVNCGGPAFTDSNGRFWAADDQRDLSVSRAPISDTDVPALYQTESWDDDLTYEFSVPNGSYTVVLRFAEIYLSRSGQRVFNVLINGQQVESNLDIAAAVGRNRALDKAFNVNSADGRIVIQLVGVTGTPKLSGIEIY